MKLNNYHKCDDLANPYVVKCALMGHFGVGKTTLGHILSEGRFDPSITTTVGMDFFSKTIKLPKYNNHSIKLQIWDTSGREKFKYIVMSYLRDVFMAFIMFDMTNRESWEEIDSWKDSLDIHRREYESIPRVVLVGTKSDKINHVVSLDEINSKAKEWNCNSYILSSKQTNSACMIYRMFNLEVEYLHEDIVHNHTNGKKIPFGFLEKDRKLYLNDDETKPKWCCFQ